MPNVFETSAKISLDSKGFDDGLDKSKNKMSVFADILKANLVEKGIGYAIEGFQRFGNIVVNTVQQTVDSYANYEQLVGGVETLFKESAGIVQDYAMEAYKTAGISANEYMQTVTSFSASLMQSLGGDTAQAAELSNRAIIDMSDNANKMGTDMGAIMYAYQGFAKQNYTMLDNLKLGYGGTKTEMERLIQEASKMTEAQRELGVTVDESSMSFANIINAISVVQKEMGIAGTTSKEAATTVEGSMKMVKSAWGDLLTSIAGGGKGMTEAIGAFVESAKTYMQNLLPVIQESLYGIGDLVKGLAPVIIEALPVLIDTVLPNILDAVMFLFTTIIDTFPSFVESVTAALPNIVSQLTDVVSDAIGMLFTSGLPMLLQLAIDVILAISDGIVKNIPLLVPALVTMLQSMVEIIVMNLPQLIIAGLQIIMALATSLSDNIGYILTAVTTLVFGIIETIVYHLPEFLELGIKIVLKIVEGIIMAIPRFFQAIGELLGIVDKSKQHVDNQTESMLSNVDFTYKSIEQKNTGLLTGMSNTAVSFGKITENIQTSSQNTAESFEETYQNALMASQGFKKVADSTNQWAKEADVKVYDSFGNVVRTFRTTTDIVTTQSVTMERNTNRSYSDIRANAERTSENVSTSFKNMTRITQNTFSEFQGNTENMRTLVSGSAKNMMNDTTSSFSGIRAGASSMSSAVTSSASAMSSEMSSAASSVESACDRMNRAMSSVKGLSGSKYGGARASGGPVRAGMSYLVGEEGPEIVTMSKNGYVHSAKETASLNKENNMTFVFNINGDIYDDENSLRRKIRNAVSLVLEEELSYA